MCIRDRGWTFINGSWYYLTPGNGAMKTGWFQVNKVWYYCNGSGAMQTGWLQLGNIWYYLNSSGAMLTGWHTLGGKEYYFNNSGAWVPDKKKDNTQNLYAIEGKLSLIHIFQKHPLIWHKVLPKCFLNYKQEQRQNINSFFYLRGCFSTAATIITFYNKGFNRLVSRDEGCYTCLLYTSKTDTRSILCWPHQAISA